jgi:HEAT repeat protein
VRIWIVVLMLGAMAAFGHASSPETVQKCRSILNDSVNDRNPDNRKGAAEALSLVGIKDNALEWLTPMLTDHDVLVRITVVTTLGDFKDKRTTPYLRKALRDPVPEVDFTAAKMLYQLHDPAGTRFLLDVVGKESKASSSYVTKETRNAMHILHTPTKLFTFVAIEAAGFAPVPGLGFGISSAQGILSDPESSARAASLLLIGNSQNPAVAEALESALIDKEWPMRAAAVHVIAMHPFPEDQEKLIPLLEDKKVAVRVRAAAAYLRLEHKPNTSPEGSDVSSRRPPKRAGETITGSASSPADSVAPQ